MKSLIETAHKRCQHKNIKEHWHPLQIYRNSKTAVVFCFIPCHLNYANIVWGSTYKSKLEWLYLHQKQAARIINFRDRFTHAQSLLHDMKTLHIFQKNIFGIIFFTFKCKKVIALTIFHNFLKPKPEKFWWRGNLTEPFYRKKYAV